MESFFGALKTELMHRTRFPTRREAKAALFEYIEVFYNRQRRHSSVGLLVAKRLDLSKNTVLEIMKRHRHADIAQAAPSI